MPATIPSHQAAVLPLKLRYPHRFDGVALVVGSAAPDVAYTVEGFGVGAPSHSWHAQFWYTVPLTLVLAWLIRRAAPFVAAHLPAGGPLALHDYGVLGAVRHPLRVSALSAVVGGFSHVVWDSFTHPYILIGHPFFGSLTYLPALHLTAVAGLPWWRVLHLLSEVVGTAVTLAVVLRIGRRRLLVAWHGQPPDTAPRPRVFWPVAGAVAASLAVLVWFLPGNGVGIHIVGARVIAVVALALLAGAAAAFAVPKPEDVIDRAPIP
jgi:hypothetical protein